MRTHAARILAITGFVFALNACNSAQKTVTAPAADAAQVPYKIERWQRDIELTDAITSIKIENLHGNLTLKQTDAASIGIQGVEQKLGLTPEHARFEVSTVGSQLQLSIIYASDAVSGADARVDGHLKGRVDLAVFVPKDVALELRTSYGDLVVRRLHNPMRAQSGSGRISVSTSQVSELISQTGNINYLPSDCAAASGAKIQTNGARAVVDVPVYCALRLDVHAKSLILGQKPVALTAGRWQQQFPQAQKPQPNLAATPVMQIATPNAALTLSVMREKNNF
jgi:hypothetical protein